MTHSTMAETDAKLHNGLLYIVFPSIAIFFILIRLCGFNKATIKASIFYSFCRYVHWICRREKALLFEQLKDSKSRSRGNTFTILEVGVGSGLNFKFFPHGSEVTGLDPDPNSEKYLMENLKKSENNVKFVKFINGFAENMKADVPSDSFDAVVCTFTMCSIEKLDEALEEIWRVLKPGGRFFFLEHVASQKGSSLRFIQNMLQRIIQLFFHHHHHHHHHHGNINRETGAFLDNSKFKDVQYCHFTAKTWLAFFAKPCIYGSAMK